MNPRTSNARPRARHTVVSSSAASVAAAIAAVALGALILLPGALPAATSVPPGTIEILDEAASRPIFAADTRVEKLAERLQFTEGPVWIDGPEAQLIFSDIPANQLKSWTPRGGVATFRAPSRNANGNTLDLEGRLVTAEHSGRQITVTLADGTVKTVVARHDGKRFNSPNDVVVKSDGTFWFTDPPYGLPKDQPKEQPGNHVYRFDPASGKTSVVITDFDMPNGLCFSPDESRLYVADSGKPRHIRVFDVQANGTVTNGRVFCTIDVGGPDGIRCDQDGRIWSSSGDGAQVFTPDGRRIARIRLPKGAANLCFGGHDGKTLFLTARDTLYAVQTNVRDGVRRLKK